MQSVPSADVEGVIMLNLVTVVLTVFLLFCLVTLTFNWVHEVHRFFVD